MLANSTLKIQLHRMFTDTKLNSITRVLHTLYQSFLESAMKVYRYIRCLASQCIIDDSLVISELRLMARLGSTALIEAL